ncbi:adenosylcobinamide-GDP ribazoletransferase [Massilia sp. PWRC2]|uniref:adenosylcobinamide-GDP ribazoletransferase n=1 Tax=Massilia sp. PWRC2 TaxID=2804626 RepID=UPI003CFBA4AA
MHQLRLFFTALQFFTRLPIPAWVGFAPEWLNQAARYFPLVGVIVAAISAALYVLAVLLLPAPVAVVIATAGTIYATGAFHEDGFADMCDGFGGGMTAERVLEIMKDSRIGAYGAIGTVCMLGLKCTALASMPPLTVIGALFAAHVVSRWLATALIWRMHYARAEGKAKPLAQSMRAGEFAIATATTVAVLAIVGASGVVKVAALGAGVLGAAIATVWLGRLFARRIGGYTGDCLGAVQQVGEVMVYLGVLATLGDGALT